MYQPEETHMTNTTMFVHSYETMLMEYKDYRIRKYFLLYVPPILLTIGTIGNLFSFFILRQSMTRISTYFYLAVLSLADLVVLYMGLLRLWTGELMGIDVRNENDWICKLIVLFGYACSDFSVWLIVAVTIERYIAVCHPLQASVLCSVQKARTLTVVLCSTLIAINLHFIWTVDLSYTKVNGSMIAKCQAVERFEVLVLDIWPWVDAGIYSFIPCLLLSVLNFLIIRQVLLARRYRCQLQNCKSGRNNQLQKRLPSEGTIKLTLMLLTVSFSFMLTTLPNNISLILSALWGDEFTLPQLARFSLATTVTELLMYVNHSMNFFLYCATGKKFRRNIEKLICKFKLYRRSLERSSPNSMLLTRVSFSGARLSMNNINSEIRPLRRGTEV